MNLFFFACCASLADSGASAEATGGVTVAQSDDPGVTAAAITSATSAVAGEEGEPVPAPAPASDPSSTFLGTTAMEGEAASAPPMEVYMGPSADFAAVAAASSADPSMFTFGELDDEDLEDFE